MEVIAALVALALVVVVGLRQRRRSSRGDIATVVTTSESPRVWGGPARWAGSPALRHPSRLPMPVERVERER